MQIFTKVAILVCLLNWSVPAHADRNPEDIVNAYISKQLHRLALTPNQRKKMSVILASTSFKRRTIFNAVGIKSDRKASWAQLIKLQYKILQIAPGARAKVARVLKKNQLSVYDQIRNEVKQLLKDMLM